MIITINIFTLLIVLIFGVRVLLLLKLKRKGSIKTLSQMDLKPCTVSESKLLKKNIQYENSSNLSKKKYLFSYLFFLFFIVLAFIVAPTFSDQDRIIITCIIFFILVWPISFLSMILTFIRVAYAIKFLNAFLIKNNRFPKGGAQHLLINVITSPLIITMCQIVLTLCIYLIWRQLT